MLCTTTCLILLFILNRFVCENDYDFISNLKIEPYFAILNSTSTSVFVCTKYNDDNQGFEVTTYPVILSDNLKIYEHRQNRTTMEIIIDSFDFIGVFQLICSSIDNQSFGNQADVYIGRSPGEFTHVKPCIVYDDQYIDCIIHMPIMISVIQTNYPRSFHFIEIHRSSKEENAYHQGKLMTIDDKNQTITFRWFPIHTGIFPRKLRMLIMGTVKYFGTTNLTIDTTPNIWIKPNITIENISSSSFQIHIHHNLFLSCRMNLTNDNKNNVRRFSMNNLQVISIDQLNSNTWYQLCIQCQRNTSFRTINEIQCLRKQTKQSWVWLIYPSLVIVLIIITAFLYRKTHRQV